MTGKDSDTARFRKMGILIHHVAPINDATKGRTHVVEEISGVWPQSHGVAAVTVEVTHVT